MKKKLSITTLYLNLLEQNRWVFGLQGILTTIFGKIALFVPVITKFVITIILVFYAVVDNIFALRSEINQARQRKQLGGLIFSGILGITFGLSVLTAPQIASIALTFFLWTILSLWVITIDSFELAAAIKLCQEIYYEWLLALKSFFFVVIGVSILILFWVNSLIVLVASGWLICINSLASGIALLMLASQIFKKIKKLPEYGKMTQKIKYY